MDCSTTEINFLGVTVMKVYNNLETDLYCKATDTHQYIQSCESINHVMSCSKIIYSLQRGSKKNWFKNCSTKEKVNSRLQQLKL